MCVNTTISLPLLQLFASRLVFRNICGIVFTMSGVDFIGIGVPRAATSWLFNCLREHPEVCDNLTKQTTFFSKNWKYQKGIEYYLSFFENCQPEMVKGEFSPQYFISEEAPSRIQKHFPRVKLIVCLRDPVQRVYSHWWFLVNKNRINPYPYTNFRDAIKKDPSLLEYGFYYKHLSRWLEYFPESQVKVMIYEDLQKDPIGFIQEVYEFLGIKSFFKPVFANKDISVGKEIETRSHKFSLMRHFVRYAVTIFKSLGLVKLFRILGVKNSLKRRVEGALWKRVFWSKKRTTSRPLISEKDRRFLEEVYKEDISHLEQFLARDLSRWGKHKSAKI